MRALAAISIFVYHAWVYGPKGDEVNLGPLSERVFQHLPMSVWLFFVLSGFLLYRPFVAAVMRERPLPDVRAYLRNRALRIVPAYWVILFVVGIVFGAALVRESPTQVATGFLHDPWVLLQNAAFLQNYRPGSLSTGIGPAWTLNVEVIFYLALPVLAGIAVLLARRAHTRAGRLWAVLAPAVLLILLGLFGKSLVAFVVSGPEKSAGWDGDWHSVLVRSFLVHADKLGYGMLVAVARVEWEDGRLSLPPWWRKAAVAAILVLAAVATRFTVSDHWWRGELSNYAYGILTTWVCALFLALVVLPRGDRSSPRLSGLVRVLESRPLVAVGLASYSFYLWHEPLLRTMHEEGLMVGGAGGYFVNLLVAGTIVGILSTLTYRFVEVPALRRKKSMRREAQPAPEREGEREGAGAVPAYQQAAP